MITAIEFCDQYVSILEMLDFMLVPSYHPALRKLYTIEPEDFATPESVFASDGEMVGFVLSLIIKTQREIDANGNEN